MATLAVTSAAGQTGWAHQAADFQSNGAITVKSLAAGTYSGTQNPTGAAAKTNQNSATQAPTVIIQATSTGGAHIAGTTAVHDGNLGGVAGGNAMCVAEFGADWKMATVGRISSSNVINTYSWYWVIPPANSSYTCSGWTNNTSAAGLAFTNGSLGSSNYYLPSFGPANCNQQLPVLCANF